MSDDLLKLLSELRKKNIQLQLNGENLKINAPAGVLNDEIKNILKTQKAALVDFLQRANAQEITQVVAVDRSGELPQSLAQERLWFLYQMQANASYNMAKALVIHGPLQIDLLQQAFQVLVNRHESLRTRFATNAQGMAIQCIEEQLTLDVPLIDLTALSPEQQESQASALALQEAGTPFDLTRAPMIRIKILRRSVTEHILLLTLHHIIADGWSLGVLVHDIMHSYAALKNSDHGALAPLSLQYADFAVWQRQMMQAEVGRQQVRYWQKALEGVPDLLDLPTDHVRPEQQSFRGAAYHFTFDANQSIALRQFAQQRDITLFMLLLGAFQLLLGRLSQQEDVSVGVPVAGRDHPQSHGLIGFFINALVMRGDMRGNPTVEEFLQRIRKTTLEAFEHQNVPMEEVLKNLNLRRNAAFNPGAQVGFSWQAGLANTLPQDALQAVAELSIDNFDVPHSTTIQDLTLSLWEGKSGIEGRLEYATDLFNASTIEQWVTYYRHMLSELVEHPTQSIHNLALMSRQHLLAHLGLESYEVEDILPLTPMQRDIYLDASINPHTVQNSMAYSVALSGQADIALCQKATEQLVAAEPMLRSEYRSLGSVLGDQLVQIVRTHGNSTLQVLDWRAEKLSGEALAQRIKKQLIHPYDIHTDRLFCHYLILLDDSQYLLAASSHHINSDGVGMSAHVRKWVAYYESLLGNEVQVPQSDYSFAAQVDLIRARSDRQETIAFWQEKFRTVEPLVFTLPARDTQLHSTEQRIVKQQCISETHWLAISKFCRRHRIVPALYFKMLYGYLLKHYCRATVDFDIVEFSSGRTSSSLLDLYVHYEQQPFVFSQASLVGLNSFGQLLEYGRDQQKNSRDHRHLSISKKLRLMQPGPVIFTYNYLHFEQSVDFMGQAIDVTLWPPVIDQSIQFVVSQRQSGVSLNIDYSTHHFRDYDFLTRMLWLSEQLVQNPDIKLCELKLLLPNEQDLLLTMNALVQRPLPEASCVQALFEQQVLKTPNARALCFKEKQYTYHELNQQANQLAHYLRAQKIGRNQLLAICLPRGIEMMVALLGTLKAGAAYLPLDPAYPEERLAYILNDSQSAALITFAEGDEKMARVKAGMSGKLILLDALSDDLHKQAQHNPEFVNDIDDLIYVIYTSGSTGQPKGSGVKHRGELNLLQWYVRECALQHGSSVMMLSAFGFDLTQKNLLAPLVSGATLVLPEGELFDAPLILEQVQQHRISLINCAPSVFYPLVELAAAQHYQALSTLQQVIFGGEPIQMDKLLPWLQHEHCQAQIVNNYGPTECTDIAAFFRVRDPNDFKEKPVPVGRANDNVALYLVNEDNQLLPPGLIGELCISGEGVGTGYLNQEVLNHQSFQTNPYADEEINALVPHREGLKRWYRSGDLMRHLPDGTLEFISRKDFQVKVRGLRIEPGEIEWALRQSDWVDAAVVLAYEDKLLAFALKAPSKVTDGLQQWDWRAHLRNYLPDTMLPSQLCFLDQWPLTPNGKIDRKALPALIGESAHNYVAPRNPVEAALADIWAQVLGLDKVGIEDNFFQIGGHSLLATRIISRCRQRFNVDLPLRELFESPTVATLALLIEHARGQQQAPAITPVPPGVAIPLSFAQQRLWFIDQLNPGNVAYLMPGAFRIKGALDTARLIQALKKLVDRHAILRTRICTEEGEGWQQVYDAAQWQVDVIDLSEQKTAHTLEDLIKINSNTPLDLAQDALFKVSLIRISDTENVLLTCMHHIIGDGWSFAILLNELAHFYAPAARPLPALPVQYGDYALWQRQWMQGEVLEQHIHFWRQHLSGAPAVLNLPTDRPRPKIQSFEGDNYFFCLEPLLAEKVKNFAKENQLTLFMVLLGAYKIQLARYSGQKDICVGLPIAGRAQSPTEQLIGLFLNAIVVRTRFEGNATLAQFYQQLKSNVLACFEHQELPAEILLEQLNVERSLSYPPVAQVGFQLQNFAEVGELPAFSGLELESLPLGRVSSKYDMTFILKESSDGLSGVVEYSTLLFDQATIKRFVAHYVTLLEALVMSTTQRIYDLQLLDSLQMGIELKQFDAVQVNALSHMQRDLVLLNRANPDTLNNCFGGAVIFPEAVDAQLLRQAIDTIARQSTILRSRICLADKPWLDEAYQVVFATLQVDWDMRNDMSFDSKEQVESYVKQFVFRPYDLNGNLLRFQLLQSNSHAYLLIAAHHALMDGVGVASLVATLLDVYYALKEDRECVLPEEYFPLYMHKERDVTDTPEAIHYWREKLQNTSGLSQYRSTAQFQHNDSEQIERSFVHLDEKHWQAIKHYCRAQRITPALYFKGLFGLLIHLYCHPEDDFSIYELSSALLSIKLNAAGCTVQRRPFIFERKSMEGEQRLENYFHHLREEQSAIHKSGLHTSILTQKYLVPEGRISFMYNYYHFTREFEVAGHTYETLLYPNDVEQVHLVVNFKLGQLSLGLHYPAGKFDALNFLSRMELISRQIVMNHVEHIKSLDFVLEHEHSVLRDAFTGEVKSLEHMPLIAQKCAQSVKAHAKQTAVKCGDMQISYADLNQSANVLACVLQKQGVACNSRVAICLPRTPDLMVALLAIIKTGAAYVPVDISYPQERIRYIVQDSAATLLISASCLRDRLPELNTPCVWVDTQEDEQAAFEILPASSSLNDIFYVIYTSGSTGQPKGATVRQQGVCNLLDWYIQEFDLHKYRHHLIISAFGFDLTQKNLWSSLLTGGTLHFPVDDHYHPQHLIEQICREGIEVINCAPSALYGLVDACEDDYQKLSSLRWVILGGEPIVLDKLRPWLGDSACRAQLVNNYGPTECTDIAAFYRLDNIHRRTVPIGRPNTNVKLHLVNEAGQAMPPGIMGELCISGAGVGAGYLNKPELNAKAFQTIFGEHEGEHKQWYRSGDLMCLSPDGDLEFVGRKDFQVKLRGLRIELQEVEWALRLINGVEDSLVQVRCVMGEHAESSAENLERLIAYVLGADSLNEINWFQHLSKTLPAYMIPAQVIVLSQWPLTPNGKIDRSALPRPEEMNATPFVAPRDEIEQQLAQIWCEVLGLASVGVLDNFFAVGGNSLLAVRIVARMEKHFAHTFALSMLFSAQTIAELAQRVNRQVNPHSWTPLIEIKAARLNAGENPQPPLFFIHPVGGTVLCYQPLAEALHRLNPRRAIYGLQCSGLDGEQLILHHFDAMAALYAQAIQSVQPQGPYYLLGQSMGGNIAWELAQQLRAQQQIVTVVGLLDSFVPQRIPEYFRHQDTVSLLQGQFGHLLHLDWQAMKQQTLETQIKTFYDAAHTQGLLSNDLTYEHVRRLALVMKANAEALLAYQAQTYTGRVLHVRASENTLGDSSVGWDKLVVGEFLQHALPATHDGILQAPAAEKLAHWLTQQLMHS